MNQLRQAVLLQLQDVGQPRRDCDNTVQITVVTPDTKIPYIKVQFQRHELKKFLDQKYIGHLDGQHIEGMVVT